MKPEDQRSFESTSVRDRDRERDDAWDALAARRSMQIESGEETPVPVAEVLARLRSELK